MQRNIHPLFVTFLNMSGSSDQVHESTTIFVLIDQDNSKHRRKQCTHNTEYILYKIPTTPRTLLPTLPTLDHRKTLVADQHPTLVAQLILLRNPSFQTHLHNLVFLYPAQL